MTAGLLRSVPLHARTAALAATGGKPRNVRPRPTTIMSRRADEDVGRDRERRARLAHAAEVHDHEEDDEADGDLDPPGVERRDRRDDVVDAGGDRHGDREHVVDEQGGGDDDARDLAEVLARDLVVAAAATGRP